MAAREQEARELEARREIRFELITNSASAKVQVLEQLCTLKNIFATQLPKMPREYIVRLVFDRRHLTLALVKAENEVLGGICFRPYADQRFAEIAFCAITAAEQVRGFGTRVMNHLKEHAKRVGLEYFLTYADNHAIGYFQKLGFSQVLTLPEARWRGYIKDYDGGTLMECKVHPKVDYLNLDTMLSKQRARIYSALERALESAPPCSLQRTVEVEPAATLLERLPGLAQLGYTEAELQAHLSGDVADARARHASNAAAETEGMARLVETSRKHDASWPFLEPVDTATVTDYLSVVPDPTDLHTIHERCKARGFASYTDLSAEILRMLQNCRDYNGSGVYVRAADALEKHVLNESRAIETELRNAKESGQPPNFKRKRE